MRGGWDVALEEQHRLALAADGENYMSYLTKFGESRARERTGILAPGNMEHYAREEKRQLTMMAGCAATATLGEPVWVSSEVLDIVDAAVPTFAPEKFLPEYLFTFNGFAFLERPIMVLDKNTKRIGVRAISWMLASEAEGAEGARPSPEALGEAAGVLMCHWSRVGDEDDFDPMPTIDGSKLILADAQILRFGEEPAEGHDLSRRYFAQHEVLFRLAQQKIARPQRAQVARPTWRGTSNWRQIKHVTVMTLRSFKDGKPVGEAGDANYAIRFLVSGHWRWQNYKVEGEWVKKQVWINTYEKGDPDKPLVVKDRAIEFIR